MKIKKTRIAYLGYAMTAPNLWRVIDLSDGRKAAVGPLYVTEKELLCDFDRYVAASWGELGASDKTALTAALERISERSSAILRMRGHSISVLIDQVKEIAGIAADAVEADKAASGSLTAAAVTPVMVRTSTSDGWDVEWNIECDLSDRWGDRNDALSHRKPSQDQVFSDPALLERLRMMMRDELTFIVNKDGKFGVLFEMEMCTDESEQDRQAGDTWPPRSKVDESLVKTMKLLEEQFPNVEFCMPDHDLVYMERSALWAFCADGLVSDKELSDLEKAFLQVGYGPSQTEAAA